MHAGYKGKTSSLSIELWTITSSRMFQCAGSAASECCVSAQTCHLDLVSGLSIAQEVGADTLLLGVLLVFL